MNKFNSLKHSRAVQMLLLFGLNPQRLRLLPAMALCLAVWSMPAMAQFAGGVVAVDPTSGAQLLAKFIVDGLLYIVASAAFVCFCWGIFRLFSRPLEGIMEICLGLIVFGLIGHALGWDSALTNVVVG